MSVDHPKSMKDLYPKSWLRDMGGDSGRYNAKKEQEKNLKTMSPRQIFEKENPYIQKDWNSFSKNMTPQAWADFNAIGGKAKPQTTKKK